MSVTTLLRSLLIDLPTAGSLALRALVFWLLVHAAYASVVLLAGYGGTGDAVTGSPIAPPVGVVPLIVLLCDTDVRITREAIFLAHLGIGRRHIAVLALVVASAAELAFHLVVAAAAS